MTPDPSTSERPRQPHTQWQRLPWSLGVCILVFVLVCVAAYRYGIPAAASFVAARLPASLTRAISQATLTSLDAEVLAPSTLSVDRRRQIDTQFEQLAPASPGVHYRLDYRDGGALGANAIALPSGDIVLTDALVMLAQSNDEVMGVLAHEIAHVEARHGLRLVLQGSAVAVIVGIFVGDMASLLTVAPGVLLQAKYSRDFERAADARAVGLMRAHGIAPSRLADMLERIEAWDDAGRPAIGTPGPVEAAVTSRAPSGNPGTVERRALGVMDYVSSHPATPERLKYLRSR